jgi:hypothetical protein
MPLSAHPQIGCAQGVGVVLALTPYTVVTNVCHTQPASPASPPDVLLDEPPLEELPPEVAPPEELPPDEAPPEEEDDVLLVPLPTAPPSPDGLLPLLLLPPQPTAVARTRALAAASSPRGLLKLLMLMSRSRLRPKPAS